MGILWENPEITRKKLVCAKIDEGDSPTMVTSVQESRIQKVAFECNVNCIFSRPANALSFSRMEQQELIAIFYFWTDISY